MRILCGIDTQYTGKVTLSSDGNNSEDDDTIEIDSDVDNAISEEIFGSSSVSRKIVTSDVKRSGNITGQDFSPSSTLKQKTKYDLGLPVTQTQSNRGRDHQSEFAMDIETDSQHGRVDASAERLENNDPRSSYSHLCIPCLSAQYWREIVLHLIVSLFQIFARIKRFIKRKESYYFPPKGGVQRCVGWCSQEDALFDYLTVREHIELFDDLLGGPIYGDGCASPAETYNASTSTSAAATGATAGNVETQGNSEFENKKSGICSYISRIGKRVLAFFMESDSRKSLRSSQEDLLHRLGMTEHAEKYALELSGSFVMCENNFSVLIKQNVVLCVVKKFDYLISYICEERRKNSRRLSYLILLLL